MVLSQILTRRPWPQRHFKLEVQTEPRSSLVTIPNSSSPTKSPPSFQEQTLYVAQGLTERL